MNVTVFGTGYVGLVAGACFAEMGNYVCCVDVDQAKIDGLKKGSLPIYEPSLDLVVISNHKAGRPKFTTFLPDAMQDGDIHFIAVGAPPGEDGSADLKYVLAVAREIGCNLQRCAVINDKPTVPIDPADKVKDAIQAELNARNASLDFDVVSNPAFLEEGAAVEDFMRPDHIVIGAESVHAQDVMTELYAPFNRNHQRLTFMGVRDVEMTRHAAIPMLLGDQDHPQGPHCR